MENVLLESLQHNPIPHTPIWLMRQAGRYLPEYRELRAKAGSFMNLCTNPELASKVTLQPLNRFNLDAAILFSDILVVPDAMGLGLHFIENEGPKFANPIKTPEDIDKLELNDIIHKLDYVFRTISHVKGQLNSKTPLIGFSGSPFTLLCYMIEGGRSSNYLVVKKWLLNFPEHSHKLLGKITKAVTSYLNAQIMAGVDVVMLFDSWGGILTESAYLEFSLPYLEKILCSLKNNSHGMAIPSTVFTKGGGIWLEHMSQMNTNCLGIDWTMDIAKAKKIVNRMALQGNLDPVILAIGDKAVLKKEAAKILRAYSDANEGNISGHIFNLGHGVLPMTKADSVAYLVDVVHELSSRI